MGLSSSCQPFIAKTQKALVPAKMFENQPDISVDKNIFGLKQFYIPILRGMRPFPNTDNDPYKDRTMEDYFYDASDGSQLKTSSTIFTGLELYKTLKEKLLGEPEDRKAVRKFEDFLSSNFFDGKEVTLIPREGKNTVHVKIGQEPQLPIYNLGDGLQSIIICTFNMFMESERCLFFIEEPDICMHPGLQRVFIEVLSRLDRHQYFITSHSNHFLDMTLDFNNISVFLFKKEIQNSKPDFKVENVTTGDSVLLRTLGVRNSAVFLTNASIWLEGITDRLYLRAYMKKYVCELKDSDPEKYKKYSSFKEDYHYSFVEYQGSNLIHWTFDSKDNNEDKIEAIFLCAPALVIADGDIIKKEDRKEVYEKILGDKLIILPCKEIENLIPLEILTSVIRNTRKKKEIDLENLEKVKYNNYSKSKTGLGAYLNRVLNLNEQNGGFGTSTGTIKNKLGFCYKAIEVMEKEDNEWSLPEPLQKLCSRVFEHIEETNSV